MVQTRGLKRPLICISSSSEEDDDQQIEQQSALDFSSEQEHDDDDDDDDYHDSDQDFTSFNSCQEDDDDESESEKEYEEDEFSDNDDVDKGADEDEEHIRNRVICLLREQDDLQELNLNECKAYLRKHGLRLSGTKAECIKRIKEHWRIKDGSGEALYPRSSFSINCTGDVCKGDVVLFTQKVYKKFDKVTRSGSLLGKRTIAGRIVKESYGAAKQQHTFTVEVLWSKGIKKLPPLSPLLVKGRNLYRLKTFRQRWKSEAERSKVLAEKHKRGAAARHIRAMKKTSHTNAGTERQKLSHHGPSRTKQPSRKDNAKHAKRQDTAPVRYVNLNRHSRKIHPAEQVNLTHPNRAILPTLHSNPYPSQYFHNQQNASSLPLPYDGACSSSTTRFQYFRLNPSSYGFNHGAYLHPPYTHFNYEHPVPRNFIQYPRLTSTYRPPPPYLQRTELYRDREYRF